MIFFILIGLFFLFFAIFFCKKTSTVSSDADKSVPEIIESRGFLAEEHKVVTSDGYILTIHRIVNPFNETPKTYPVLLQHGFAGTSAHWIINSADGHLDRGSLDRNLNKLVEGETGNNLGFALANEGYDVWLGNARGNSFSLGHSSLNPHKDNSYWDFSLDQLIEYDLTATIDHIQMTTKQKHVSYIGLSMGTTTILALLASRNEYNDIIKPCICIGPVARLTNTSHPFRVFLRFPYVLSYFRDSVGPSNGPVFLYLLEKISRGHVFAYYVQYMLHWGLQLMYGFNWNQFDVKRMDVYCSHASPVFSKRVFAQAMQYTVGDRLRKFDFGRDANVALYGQTVPPEYQLDKITNKSLCLIYSRKDKAASFEDVMYLKNALTVPLLDDYVVPHSTWGHINFVFAKDLGKLVNTKIVQILNKVNDDSIVTLK